MKKPLKIALFSVLTLLILYLGIGLSVSRFALKVTKYEISDPKLSQPLKIVQIADLHCTKFGEKLYRKIAAQKPDLIFVVGDLVDRSDSDISPALEALEHLVSLAPVYVSLGNHEAEHNDQFCSNLVEQFAQIGVTVLDREYVDIDVNGQPLRIGGIYGYCLPASAPENRAVESRFLYDFQATSRYTILLSHMPVCWLINESLDFWDVDCVLSGHTHGGQVILPIVGGLYAPDQGWFPGECSGHFQTDSKHLIITSGLGGTSPVPRFYNRPEIVSLTLLPEQ